MPRCLNATDWAWDPYPPPRTDDPSETAAAPQPQRPLVRLTSRRTGQFFAVHPLDERLVRVYHCPRPGSTRHQQNVFERRDLSGWQVQHSPGDATVVLRSASNAAQDGGLRLHIDYSLHIQISWFWDSPGAASDTSTQSPFLRDFKQAYTWDLTSGRVWHKVASEGYMPTSEHQASANALNRPLVGQSEFIYGLGESKGRLNKIGKRYVIDGRDSLGADPEETDPLYKLAPFYLRYNAKTSFWHGLWYNTLNPCVFDFHAEHDFSTGNFHSFTTEHGPLDYYVLCGRSPCASSTPTLSSSSSVVRSLPPDLPGILSQYARLVTPYAVTRVGCGEDGWSAAATLPALNQFGYLASSLTLSERQDAQAAVIDYVQEAKRRHFAIDGMHLSSGYCQDPVTNERQYFLWNRQRYPDPTSMGRSLEVDEGCQVIINVKPWLLESHPYWRRVAAAGGFVRASVDARPDPSVGGEGQVTSKNTKEPRDPSRCGAFGQARTWHWSTSMGQTRLGSYFDFTSQQGVAEWQRLIREGVLSHGITGIWIDNNEYSTLIDDEECFAGEIRPWDPVGSDIEDLRRGNEVSLRMTAFTPPQDTARVDRDGGPIDTTPPREVHAGDYGRATQTMGMARATFTALLADAPDRRPVVVTRSAVPGMQAFASATWSGDNSTTWKSLEWSTKLTLSYGLSFGLGLYGHDVGGFAGQHSPSADLLIRWCQQAAWHTRFTVHSWKAISTTLWMYDERTTDRLRAILDWRYQLVPMLYSLFVTDYFCRGCPVLRPLLWYHHRSVKDRCTLTQDGQFLLGSHVLVAPILEPGMSRVSFHLPRVVTVDTVTTDGRLEETEEDAWWYDPLSKRWLGPEDGTLSEDAAAIGVEQDRVVTLEDPPDSARSPFLVRAGGTMVTAPSGMKSTSQPVASRFQRLVEIFPAPIDTATTTGRQGHFTLVEDDGHTNAATHRGAMTEMTVHWQVVHPNDGTKGAETSKKDHIEVWVDVERFGYAGTWELLVCDGTANCVGPKGSRRRLAARAGDFSKDSVAVSCDAGSRDSALRFVVTVS